MTPPLGWSAKSTTFGHNAEISAFRYWQREDHLKVAAYGNRNKALFLGQRPQDRRKCCILDIRPGYQGRYYPTPLAVASNHREP